MKWDAVGAAGDRMLVGSLVAVLVTVLAASVACDPSSYSGSPVLACRESGAQCQLPEGPLGVCERAVCQAGEAEPCFKCTPQH